MLNKQTKKIKKTFNPRIEVFSPFSKPFEKATNQVVDVATQQAAACCACTACTACR